MPGLTWTSTTSLAADCLETVGLETTPADAMLVTKSIAEIVIRIFIMLPLHQSACCAMPFMIAR